MLGIKLDTRRATAVPGTEVPGKVQEVRLRGLDMSGGWACFPSASIIGRCHFGGAVAILRLFWESPLPKCSTHSYADRMPANPTSYARHLNLLPGKSFFLFGPRGTGKSTWLRNQLRPAAHLDLLDAAVYTRLLANPGDLGKLMPARHPNSERDATASDIVAIDEIQRIPALLHEVHRLIETTGRTFAMTGSSARTLRRAGVNLLAGRALTYRMHPLTAAELGPDFDLQRALRHGMLPSIPSEPDPDRYLASYVQTYLQQEVMQEALVRNLPGFARFLSAVSFSHAAQLNVAEVARETAVQRRTVAGWIEVLEDLLLAVRLPVFRKRAQRAVVGHPKLVFFDAGVYRALRPRGPLDRPEEIAGAALEGLVFQELRAANDLHGLGYELSFWRTRGGSEVDFVLYGERGIVAVEVKHADKVRRADLRGLRAFGQDYPMARKLLVYMGQGREQHGDVEVWPAGELLPCLARELGPAGGAVRP